MRQRAEAVVEHPALAEARGVPPQEAALSDRQRLAVLLQASSLLCHLRLGERPLAAAWEGVRVDGNGLLNGVRCRSATTPRLPQVDLRELAAALFRADRRVGGRGEARRTVRGLLKSWEQELTPLSPDQAVQQILDRAAFLWHPSFAATRSTLAAAHRWNGSERLWVAGPEWFRKPLLEGSRSLPELQARLASDLAESLWSGGKCRPEAMIERGRWRSAVAAWSGAVLETGGEKLAFAGALFAIGRFRRALEVVGRLQRMEARILRIHCLQRLGELRRAKAALARLEGESLTGQCLLDAAAAAIRVYGNLGEADQARSWALRARRGVRGGEESSRARLLSFAAAWDRGDCARMRHHLERARPALDSVRLAWRWQKAKGLSEISRGDGASAGASLAEALRLGRRRLTPLEAGDLWNEMALARGSCGDLRGAERALLHTLRLHRDIEGPRKTTLALFNLAEVRIRRGRLVGVAEILEQSSRENRLAGNWRGMAHDTELRARYDLIRGRPSAALARLEKAVDELDARGVSWRRAQLKALAARALGWLGRSREAREALACAGDDAMTEFEPEERPALWALAGDRDRAVTEITGDDVPARLWREILTRGLAPQQLWLDLAFDDDYRLARMLFDLHAVAEGCVPASLASRAAAILRRVEAAPLAERMEVGAAGSWRAVGRYLESGIAGSPDPEGLFKGSGYGEARLVRLDPGGEDEVLVDGPGGAAELSMALGSSELRLTASWTDPVLRAFLLLVARDLGTDNRQRLTGGRCSADRFGMVGESRALASALERLTQLAPEPVPILLLGETGTGKELAARRAHLSSSRADGPFVPLNCAAVSEDLLMSDLFGHVKGAYTGAVRDRVGVFESARAGTVFLDEIGDLPLRAQGFLLRVLQEGEIRRVGESVARSTDVRVITATHRDLEAMVRRGDFRADLYYRLRVAAVGLPPLRERGGDVLLLADHFLRRLRPEAPPRLTDCARATLLAHGWPGNVRELENVLSVAVAMTDSGPLRAKHLDLPAGTAPARRGYHEDVLEFRRRLIRDALASSNGNRAAAARQLGLTRQALSYLVRKLEIEI